MTGRDRVSVIAATFALLAQCSISSARADKLVDPVLVVLPGSATYTASRAALLNALDHRDWVIVSHFRGTLRALRVLGHDREAIVEINYDAHLVAFRYLDSANLDYHPETDPPTIDGKYNSLIDDLVGDIRDALEPHRQ